MYKQILSILGVFVPLLPWMVTPVAAQDVYPACLEKARSYGLSSEQLVVLCQGATVHIPLCMESAWSYGLRGSQLARVCRLAREDSATCLNAAWSHTLRGEQLVEVCKTLEPCTFPAARPVRIYYDYPPYRIIPKH